ncbi:MAG: hypothetical protein V8R55_14230 [Dysosmobacter sp.]
MDTAGGDAEQTPAETRYYLSDGEGRQVLGTDGYPIVVTDPAADLPIGRLFHPVPGRPGTGGQQPLFNG